MATKTFKNKGAVAFLLALAGLAWAGLVGLGILYNSGSYGFWFPARIFTYMLLLVAPALTFFPAARALEAPWYGWAAVVGWATFGFMLFFVPPNLSQPWNQNILSMLLFLVSLGLVFYTIGWPVFYTLGFKLFKKRVARYNTMRSHREALLLSSYVIIIFFLGAVRLLNGIYILSLFLIFLTVELLFLSRAPRDS